jgi:hypothetical protein
MNIVHVLFSVKREDIFDVLGKLARMRNLRRSLSWSENSRSKGRSRVGAKTENQVSRMDISGETFLIFAIILIIAWAAFQVWLRWHGPQQ